MSKQITIDTNGNNVEIFVTGKLTHQHYEEFVPVVEDLIKTHGKVRMLFGMRDFQGWTAGALWDDLKFDVKHWDDIERLAIVGESKWEEGMADFCKPFTSAKVTYFDRAFLDDARAWLGLD